MLNSFLFHFKVFLVLSFVLHLKKIFVSSTFFFFILENIFPFSVYFWALSSKRKISSLFLFCSEWHSFFVDIRRQQQWIYFHINHKTRVQNDDNEYFFFFLFCLLFYFSWMRKIFFMCQKKKEEEWKRNEQK